ncbi:disulfide bond formation protein B [Paramagnetospirillum kuznetsovii]|uniref:Disulfide bond formation protein B n=1 Tax=Paramagnetospirillum kuznetsovii TaxID=2053833 RepID=A0A364NTX9_9PROT|nr:disulfide bond formation protein B [Paramagnetospirillum kuznetsovii]RAU20512.1 disulfide bond formation protein B [Paramagnetospirillum kuznetsovii]
MKITTRLIAILLLVICVQALVLALVAQYGFGLRPCNLCLIQRVPFTLAAGLAAVSLTSWPSATGRQWLILVAGAALLINGGIAFYHVGVEQHWWVSAVCKGGEMARLSVSDLMAEMTRPAEAQCDTPAWSFHGITMAALNVPFSAGLGLVTLFLARFREN